MADLELDRITERIIGCAYRVSNTLGMGFIERVYANALFYEMTKEGLSIVREYPVKVQYDGIIVGEFFLDMLVNDKVIIELKAVSTLNNDHLAQSFNYLRAAGLPACLLINFGQPKIQLRRLYPSPSWKSSKS